MPQDPFLRVSVKVKEKYLSFPGLAREFQARLEGEEEYCVLDLETTGFDPEYDRIIEVAAVRMSGGREKERLHSLINPGVPISPGVRILTGIDDAMVGGSPTIEEFFDTLADFLFYAPVVAYSRFEERFLGALYPKLAGRSFQNPYIDAMDLAIMLMPCLGSHRQEDLASIWGINTGRVHRAEDDVDTLVRVYEILLNGLYNMPLPVIKALCDRAPEEPGGLALLLRRVLEERSGGRPVDRLELDRFAGRERFWEDIPPLVGDAPPASVQAKEISSNFGPEGPIARQFSDYEERDEQVEMAGATRRALESGEIFLVEAGTGTGKSLAYLVPAILWAKAAELPVVVSTKTLNLQDQLFTKDLPLLEAALGDGYFRYSVLKGYGNYLCPRKLQALIDGRRSLSEDQLGVLGMLITWLAEGGNGDVSLLNVSHLRGLDELVMADYRECPGDKCRFAASGDCFYRKALYRAKRSHIVVVNHSLLLSGVSLPFESAVIDEAHTLEDVATEQFTGELDYSAARRFLESIYSEREGTGFTIDLKADLVGGLEPKARDGAQQQVVRAQEAVLECVENLNSVFSALGDFYPGGETYGLADIRFNDERLDSLEYARLESEGRLLEGSFDKLSTLLQEIKATADGKAGEKANFDSIMLDLDGKIARVEETGEVLSIILSTETEGLVHWATVGQPGRLEYQSLKVSPIDVGPLLHEALYEQLESLVMTSATLTVNGSFEFFRSRTGLDLVDTDRLSCLVLDSSFDYRRQMQILVLHDMPRPTSRDYTSGLAEVLGRVIKAAGGGVLALFTNRRLMLKTYEELVEELAREGLTLLCQQPGFSRRRLAERFVDEEGASLFGTSSFWEGVDARGSTLRLVVVTRIPFESPGRPVFEARSERLRLQGLSDFNALSLPLAALRLKQGVGRLIRTRRDRGQALIIDSRVETEDYGRVLLKSLPEAATRRVSLDEVAKVISDFKTG